MILNLNAKVAELQNLYGQITTFDNIEEELLYRYGNSIQ